MKKGGWQTRRNTPLEIVIAGRGFIEIEDSGFPGCFFPFIVAEEDVGWEIRALEVVLEFTRSDTDTHGTTKLKAKNLALDFLNVQFANKGNYDRTFQIGDRVNVELHSYRQISVANLEEQELSPLYYCSYRIEDIIGEIAYKLALPPQSKIHPTLHVPRLRRSLKYGQEVSVNVRQEDKESILPAFILYKKMVKRENKAVMHVLVQRSERDSSQGTWKFLYDLMPGCTLGVKGDIKGKILMHGEDAGDTTGGAISRWAPPGSEWGRENTREKRFRVIPVAATSDLRSTATELV